MSNERLLIESAPMHLNPQIKSTFPLCKYCVLKQADYDRDRDRHRGSFGQSVG